MLNIAELLKLGFSPKTLNLGSGTAGSQYFTHEIHDRGRIFIPLSGRFYLVCDATVANRRINYQFVSSDGEQSIFKIEYNADITASQTAQIFFGLNCPVNNSALKILLPMSTFIMTYGCKFIIENTGYSGTTDQFTNICLYGLMNLD